MLHAWLLPAYDAWCDLGADAEWLAVRAWSNEYGIDFEWLFPVLRRAARIVREHQDKERKQKRASTARSRKNNS